MRAGMVVSPGDYRWSSYRAHAQETDDVLTENHPLMAEFGPDAGRRRLRYQEYVEARRDENEQELKARFGQGMIGDAAFADGVEREVVVNRRPRRGRPKKNGL